MKIRVIKDHKFGRGEVIRTGEVCEARRIGAGFMDTKTPYQIISRKFSGEEIPYKNCVQLPDEKTYTESEYQAVAQAAGKLHEELAGAKEANNRLIGNVNQLIDEKGALREEVEIRTLDQKRLIQRNAKLEKQCLPVVLPPEVAKALDDYQRDGHDTDYIMQSIIQAKNRSTERSIILQTFANEHGFLFATALVNGHMVEQTTEERLREGIKGIHEEWSSTPSTGSDEVDSEELASRITNFVTGFYADTTN